MKQISESLILNGAEIERTVMVNPESFDVTLLTTYIVAGLENDLIIFRFLNYFR